MGVYTRRAYLGLLASGGALVSVTPGAAQPTVVVSITETNAPVAAGAELSVRARVENRSGSTVTRTVHLVAGEETVDSRSVTVGGGSSETLTLAYETYPVQQDVTFPVTVATDDHAAARQVSVYAGDEPGVRRVHPPKEVTVSPGTTVMFEVASPLLGSFGGTEWTVGGESMGPIGDPWQAAYYDHQGADYFQHTFESAGTTPVRAVVDPPHEGGAGEHAVEWTVHVDGDGHGPPSVDAVRPSGGALTPTGETVDLEVDISSSGGDLERVVWWMHQYDVVLGVSEVSGAQDTATYTDDAASFGCHTCDIVVWVIDEHGCFVEENPWRIDEHGGGGGDGGGLSVSILGTNAPVHAGQVLSVTARLENPSAQAVTETVQLLAGEVVDSRTVTVAAGSAVTLTLGYETYPVRRDVTFDVTVAAETGSATQAVTVYGG